MDIQFKGTDFTPPADVIALLNKKVNGLARYFGASEEVRAYVELGKAVGSKHSGAIWRSEINLDASGTAFRAEATKESIEDAIQKAVSELEREIKRARSKEKNLFRKGSARVKDFLRGFTR